MYTQTILLIF